MTEADDLRIGREGAWLVLGRDDVGPDGSGGCVVNSLVVEIQTVGLAACTSVWLGVRGVEEPRDEFFATLAARTWEGMEGGHLLGCTHDGVARS